MRGAKRGERKVGVFEVCMRDWGGQEEGFLHSVGLLCMPSMSREKTRQCMYVNVNTDTCCLLVVK